MALSLEHEILGVPYSFVIPTFLLLFAALRPDLVRSVLFIARKGNRIVLHDLGTFKVLLTLKTLLMEGRLTPVYFVQQLFVALLPNLIRDLSRILPRNKYFHNIMDTLNLNRIWDLQRVLEILLPRGGISQLVGILFKDNISIFSWISKMLNRNKIAQEFEEFLNHTVEIKGIETVRIGDISLLDLFNQCFGCTNPDEVIPNV